MTGIRVREGTFEGRCDACSEWWPLTEEFWYAKRSLHHCRACENLAHRVNEALRRTDPAYRARQNDSQRTYRSVAARALAISRREREALRRMDPAYVEAQREYHRSRTREYRARQAA